MKKIVTLVIIFACLLLAMFLWKPWSYFQETRLSLSLSNESFISGSPSRLSKFKSNTEIFYKLTKSKPFGASVLTIQIYKIDKNQKESLHKERQEIGIDPRTKTFSFVLRPDYFRESGEYRVKMYIGSVKDNKLAEKYDITIE